MFYLRKNIRHYGEYSNSIHEGTNKGIKYNAVPVLPTSSLDNALIILSKNAQRKSSDRSSIYQKEYLNNKPYTKFQCGHELVKKAEAEIVYSFECANNFESMKLTVIDWFVQKKPHSTGDYISLIPNFVRTRIVTYDDDTQRFTCTCSREVTYGNICQHVAHVVSTIEGYTQPTNEDLSIFWSDTYGHIGYNYDDFLHYDNDDPTYNNQMCDLRHKEPSRIGVFVPRELVRKVPIIREILDKFLPKENSLTCFNYKLLPDYETLYEALNGLNLQVDTNLPSQTPLFGNQFQSSIDHAVYTEQRSSSSTFDPYPYLIQSFKDMVNTFKNDCTAGDLLEIKLFFQTKTADMKKQIENLRKEKNNNSELNTFISSGVVCEKRRSHKKVK